MISKKIEEYVLSHSSPDDELLNELYRETHLKILHPRMLSGRLQGKILEMISRMIQPQNILEIGTYTGYSAICLANGMQGQGKLHTIEINPELHDFAQKYFEKAGISHKVVQHTGNALEIIPELNTSWDLVFIDADKENYLNYYKHLIGRVKIGGFILADNVLWDGKVISPGKNPDKETRGIIEFNEYIQLDKRVENVLLPVRDGIMILRKI